MNAAQVSGSAPGFGGIRGAWRRSPDCASATNGRSMRIARSADGPSDPERRSRSPGVCCRGSACRRADSPIPTITRGVGRGCVGSTPEKERPSAKSSPSGRTPRPRTRTPTWWWSAVPAEPGGSSDGTEPAGSWSPHRPVTGPHAGSIGSFEPTSTQMPPPTRSFALSLRVAGIVTPMRERAVDGMRAYWNDRAKANAAWYVDTSLDYAAPDMDRFWETGRVIVAEALDKDPPAKPGGTDLAVEIGPGLGRICVALADRFDRVVGVDISEEMVSRATELVDNSKVSFVLGDGASLS